MALLDILLEGDPRLRQKSVRVRSVDESLRQLASDMYDTMMEAPGVGIAAPQVGVLRRLIWVHLPENYHDDGEPGLSVALVNPEIIKSRGRALGYEGCLSIPGWVGEVPRAEHITVKAVGLDNRPVRLKAFGWGARVLQHEIDHLDGILFIDHISALKRNMILRKLLKARKEQERGEAERGPVKAKTKDPEHAI